jgi:hypothetical protein
MTEVTATELAKVLGKSTARISQYVSGGQLEGCFTGTGRNRRFDLEKCAEALGRRLDPGQMLGNGASTKKALKEITAQSEVLDPPPRPSDGPLPASDPTGIALIHLQTKQEDLRTKRRKNAQEEGLYCLASQVSTEVQRQIAQEISGFESVMLRDGARRIADEFGLDFKEVRKELRQIWRNYRDRRSKEKLDEASSAELNEEEVREDI